MPFLRRAFSRGRDRPIAERSIPTELWLEVGHSELADIALKVMAIARDLGVRAAFHFDGLAAARVFLFPAN